jgi:mannose/fructose/N-acetylgalactosamine-specific phosphotransferase system component IIB
VHADAVAAKEVKPMKNLVLVRIDDRLIHGQVVTQWMKDTHANKVLIIDDKLPEDAFMKRVLKAAAPPGVKCIVKSIADSIPYIQGDPKTDDEAILVLVKYPSVIEALLDAGLVDYVAMDIKNAPTKYALTAGVDKYPAEIERSIDIIIKKAPEYEFRTTVVRELHEKEDIIKIANRIKNAKKYFLQSYVDSGDIISSGFSAYSPTEMLEILENTRKILPCTALRGI